MPYFGCYHSTMQKFKFIFISIFFLILIAGCQTIKDKTDNNLLLLKTEMNAGHGGKSGRDGAIEEIALDYAFALKISKKI